MVGGSNGAGEPRTLYPFVDSESDTVLHVAGGIATAFGTQLVVGEVDTSAGRPSYDTTRDVAETVLRARSDDSIAADVLGQRLRGADPVEAVVTGAETLHVNVVVLGEDVSEASEATIARRTGCDTVVVKEQTPLTGIDSVLVAVAGGPHSAAAVDVGGAIAATNDAGVELFHVLDADDEDRAAGEALLDAGASQLPESVPVETRLSTAEDTADGVVAEANDYDLTVVGAPSHGRLRQFVFGSTTTEIRDRAENTVVMVRNGSDPELSLFADELGE